MEYRREIDGLRALAVLPVILFHAGFPGFSGGYVGVDVFFVISGYLITTIIITELESGSFSIVRFYERRARRILPALFFVLAACIPFAFMWMTPSQLKDFSQGLVAVSFFSSNVLFWLKTDYFAPDAEENPLLHTWTLAVEEQFYLIFPLLLMFLWRFGKDHILYVLIALSVVSLWASEFGASYYPEANFYLLPFRAWELGMGSICAFVVKGQRQTSNSLLALVGLSLIVIPFFLYDEFLPFPSRYALAPVIGAVLIVLYSSPKNIVGRMLASRPLVGVGLISFSAYLWHQPLFSFWRIREQEGLTIFSMVLLSVASIALGAISWRLVEQPFRQRNGGVLMARGVLIFSILGILLFTVLGLYGHFDNGIPDRKTPSGHPFSVLEEMRSPNFGLGRECASGFTLSEQCRTSSQPTVLVWGDSFAMHLVQGLMSSRSFKGESLIQLTMSECSPVLGAAQTNQRLVKSWSEKCLRFNDQVYAWLLENSTVKYVVMSSPMDILFSEFYDEKGSLRAADKVFILARMKYTSEKLKDLGVRPIFISPPPRNGEDLSKCPTHNLAFNDEVECSFPINEYSKNHKDVMRFLSIDDFPYPVIALEEYLCDSGECKLSSDGVNIYRDRGHFSLDGSKLLGRKSDLFGAVVLAFDEDKFVPN